MRLRHLAAFTSLLAALVPARGEQIAPPPAAALISAVAQAPSLQAARARAEAARARSAAAGRLPDPELEGM